MFKQCSKSSLHRGLRAGQTHKSRSLREGLPRQKEMQLQTLRSQGKVIKLHALNVILIANVYCKCKVYVFILAGGEESRYGG